MVINIFKNELFKNMSNDELIKLKDNIIYGKEKLSDNDISLILKTVDSENLEKLFWIARKIREHNFQDNIFLYGFVYFSTYCKNECSFCYYNSKNKINRYRLTLKELISICNQIKYKPIHMIDLTMGEDLFFYENKSELLKYIKTVKEITNLDIMISPGVIDKKLIDDFKNIDVSFLALYQETYDRNLYRILRPKQSFDRRYNLRSYAKKKQILIEDGILTGINENEEDEINTIIHSIREMECQNLDQIRVMTFEPQKGTLFENKKQQSELMELKVISILRLLFPDKLIPASLDINGISGMIKRLNAGANVVTSIIEKNSKLDGVVNFDKNIEYDKRSRDVNTVISSLMDLHLKPASICYFKEYIKRRKNNL